MYVHYKRLLELSIMSRQKSADQLKQFAESQKVGRYDFILILT